MRAKQPHAQTQLIHTLFRKVPVHQRFVHALAAIGRFYGPQWTMAWVNGGFGLSFSEKDQTNAVTLLHHCNLAVYPTKFRNGSVVEWRVPARSSRNR